MNRITESPSKVPFWGLAFFRMIFAELCAFVYHAQVNFASRRRLDR